MFSEGFRYRKNVEQLPGRPDIVLPKYKTVILVHGCFWHGHNCRCGKIPETNKLFWEEKIIKNKIRDLKNMDLLKQLGWNVFIIWQCEIKNNHKRESTLSKLSEKINSSLNEM